MTWLKKNFYLLSLFLYFPALINYFSGDDWFHLSISNINSFSQFLNFFSFNHTTQSAAFYRPLPTQVFFFTFQKIFGLSAWPYYLFALICFGYSLYLVNKFATSIFNDKHKGQLTAIIYGLSVSNFTRLYFLSAFQEIALVIFSLLCLLNFKKSKFKSTIFFILALLSKETAIVLPIILLFLNYKEIIKSKAKFLPIIVLSGFYLLLRLKVFGMAQGDSYLWNFSPSKAANTLLWYILWSFGAPELLVDYIGSGLRPIARFYSDFPYWWQTILVFLSGTIASFAVLVIKKIRKIDHVLLKSVFIFLISLSPVIFLPQHKFALELGLPLVGFSMAIAWFVPSKKYVIKTIFLIFFVCLNLSMNYLTYTRHYSVNRSTTAKRLFTYFSKNYPTIPQGKAFEFINDTSDYGKDWGSSKQISNITSGSEMFRVIYKDPSLEVYFQDNPQDTPIDKELIKISTKQFFQVQ